MRGQMEELGEKSSVYSETINDLDVFIDPKLPAEIILQLDMLQIREGDLGVLRSLQPVIKEYLERMINDYLEQLIRDPLYPKETSNKIHNVLQNHLTQLFRGRVDLAFIKSSQDLAYLLYRTGLSLDGYIAATQNVIQLILVCILREEVQSKEQSRVLAKVIAKIFCFELQVVLKSYQNIS
ncbi:protoglobin domain-containing protein [Cytobacillus sp. FJAT-54145]|uniref:Protoglobin domain-containing protein n=1 Tax=Cytobacillus spartinae TaxID=3299023 RepID=A0ABW6KG30_9BACI